MNEIEKSSEKENLIIMLICLVVCEGTAVYYYGFRAFTLGAVSVVTCTAADFICGRLRNSKKYDTLSAVICGLMLSVMMSAAVSYYVIILAGIFGMGIVRHAFGGKENEIFPPACTAYLFAEICFPAILSYPKIFSDSTETLFPSLTSITERGAAGVTDFELLMGNFSYPMGISSLLLVSVIALFLFIKKISSAEVFFSMTLVYGAYSFVSGGAHDLKYNLCLGMYIFCGAFFISQNAPEKLLNKIIYGIAAGLFVSLFRYKGMTENPVVYAAVLSAPVAEYLKQSEKNSGGEKNAAEKS